MTRCILCNSNKQDEILYGSMVEKDDIHAHLNCLYLSTCLVQEVDETSTIPNLYGFTLSSIYQEAERVKKNICCYCDKYKANVSCCEAKCRRTFHMICGENKNALYEFCNTFRSFCDKHGQQLTIKPSSNENCCICYDRLKKSRQTNNRSKILQSPCCRNGWYHKYCLQKYAQNAGYYFKCPLCNDEDKFREEVAKLGIFVLDRDAVWELELNAYHELMERPNICSAEHCTNLNGREDATNSEFIMCSSCGHAAIHEDCLNTENNQFICTDCNIFAMDSNITITDTIEQYLTDTFVDIEAQTKKLINELTTTTTPTPQPPPPTNVEHEESEDDFPVLRKIHRKTSNIFLSTPELNDNNYNIDENDDNMSEISALESGQPTCNILYESKDGCSIIKPQSVHHKRIRITSSNSDSDSDSEMENIRNYKSARNNVNDEEEREIEENEDCEYELVLKKRKKSSNCKRKRARRLTSEFEEDEETHENNNINNNNKGRYYLRSKPPKLLNASLLAYRTRGRGGNKKENQQSEISMDSDQGLVDSRPKVRRKRFGGVNLNMSCIAQRTRRSQKYLNDSDT